MAAKKINPAPAPLDPAQLDPQDAAGYAQRAWAFYARGEFASALADFKAALNIDPENLDALYALALSAKMAGQQEEARARFSEFLALIGRIEERDRVTMLRRLALGHLNHINSGDWNLEKEVWHRR